MPLSEGQKKAMLDKIKREVEEAKREEEQRKKEQGE